MLNVAEYVDKWEAETSKKGNEFICPCLVRDMHFHDILHPAFTALNSFHDYLHTLD